jgi:tellurite methyltransferase
MLVVGLVILRSSVVVGLIFLGKTLFNRYENEGLMELDYWNEYYKKQSPGDEPSNFAKFCIENYRHETGAIFDLGCGNGRDTLFFSSMKLDAFGLEQSESVVEKNVKKNLSLGLKAKFMVEDFSRFEFDTATKGDYSIYSRFTLHAISYEEQDRLFKNIKSAKRLRYLFIEARSIHDDLYGHGTQVGEHEFITSHYRRFIDPKILIKSLKDVFKIISFEESRNFSVIEGDNPCLIRVIAKRLWT